MIYGFSGGLENRLQEREEEKRKLIAEPVNLQDLLVKPRDIPRITELPIRMEIARSPAAGNVHIDYFACSHRKHASHAVRVNCIPDCM